MPAITDEASLEILDEGASGILDESGSSAVVTASAAFSSSPVLTAAAQPVADDLWIAYLAAYQAASDKWVQWRMMRQAGGTDGTAGFLFGQAYEAQGVSDQAYEAWRLAQQHAYPGSRG